MNVNDAGHHRPISSVNARNARSAGTCTVTERLTFIPPPPHRHAGGMPPGWNPRIGRSSPSTSEPRRSRLVAAGRPGPVQPFPPPPVPPPSALEGASRPRGGSPETPTRDLLRASDLPPAARRPPFEWDRQVPRMPGPGSSQESVTIRLPICQPPGQKCYFVLKPSKGLRQDLQK